MAVPLNLSPSVSVVEPRPFIKWAGGKGRLLDQYAALFPQDWQRYHEPFLGGGAVFFHLQPQGLMGPGEQGAYLSDINPALVNVYRCVRDQGDALLERLQIHQRLHCREYYYQVRSQHDLSGLDHAARFIYLNKTCYNGLYRENRQGQFNVPMGQYKKPAIYDPERLRTASVALQGTQLQRQGFTAILDQAQGPTDFVYFDPPYFPLSPTSSFTAYSRAAFGEAEQRQLREVFGVLAQNGVKVMLSNSDCPFIRELYRDFPIHTITAGRVINSKGGRRGKITEVVVTSYEVMG